MLCAHARCAAHARSSGHPALGNWHASTRVFDTGEFGLSNLIKHFVLVSEREAKECGCYGRYAAVFKFKFLSFEG